MIGSSFEIRGIAPGPQQSGKTIFLVKRLIERKLVGPSIDPADPRYFGALPSEPPGRRYVLALTVTEIK